MQMRTLLLAVIVVLLGGVLYWQQTAPAPAKSTAKARPRRSAKKTTPAGAVTAAAQPTKTDAQPAAGQANDGRTKDGPTQSVDENQPVATADRKDDMHPIVVLETNYGPVTLRLDREHAPETVENFLGYVESGHYDGTIFHQVLAGQIVLGGGYNRQLEEKPVARTVPNEAANGVKNRAGTIAMARPLETVDGSNCQFFVNLSDNPQLDHEDDSADGYGYCVFGEVIAGIEVLTQISRVDVHSVGDFELLPVQTVLIESAARLR